MLALDIDGTLIGPDMELSPRLVAAIGEAVRRGVRVSLATGRMPSSAVVFANRLGLVEPIIGHQGAIVRAMPAPDARTDITLPPFRGRIGRILSHQPLAPDVISDAVRWCYANGLNPHVNTVERMIVQEGDPNFADYSAYLGRDAETVRPLLPSDRFDGKTVLDNPYSFDGCCTAHFEQFHSWLMGWVTASRHHEAVVRDTKIELTKRSN
jgi:hydroxymethylpyrimidine pyrophosphatase-like HAD family hydrolase